MSVAMVHSGFLGSSVMINMAYKKGPGSLSPRPLNESAAGFGSAHGLVVCLGFQDIQRAPGRPLLKKQ